MTIEQAKQKIRGYRDFFGYDIIYQQEIEEATTFEELCEILTYYDKHIEDMCNDAQNHLSRFRKELGIDDLTT